jgi:hypothetical protein
MDVSAMTRLGANAMYRERRQLDGGAMCLDFGDAFAYNTVCPAGQIKRRR